MKILEIIKNLVRPNPTNFESIYSFQVADIAQKCKMLCLY